MVAKKAAAKKPALPKAAKVAKKPAKTIVAKPAAAKAAAKLASKAPVSKKAGRKSEAGLTEPTKEANLSAKFSDEEDEGMDFDDMGAASGAGMMAAGVAAPGKESASFKNFRHLPDIENFFRFIYENELRYDALGLIDQYLVEKRNRKKAKAARVRPN